MTYYNEICPKAAAWLRELIAAGHLPQGTVDERSIADVSPNDLRGFRQCHFFAGIGGWPYALRLAGWPDNEPVWTGSCPCQPFSCAGRGRGESDPRHLWPEFFRLIAECRPPVVFGEQVASAAGRGWLAGVRADLEGVGYGVGAADLCAAGVGAPHIRQRLFWVADAARRGLGADGGASGDSGHAEQRDEAGGVGDADDPGPQGHGRLVRVNDPTEWQGTQRHDTAAGFWDDARWHDCRDGKRRRVPLEPAIFPLAPGLPGRVGLLRGAGNAIVPQVAAAFIEAYLGTQHVIGQ